jgi:hypothetical protein
MINSHQSKYLFLVKENNSFEFSPNRHITLERRQIALHEYIESQEEKRAFAFPPTQTGSRLKSLLPGTTDTIDSHLTNQTDTNSNFLSPDSIMSKSTRNPTNLLVKFRDQTTSKKSPSPSPPSTPMLNGSNSQAHLSNGTSPNESLDRLNKSNMKTSTSKINNFFHRFSKEQQAHDAQAKNIKRTVKLSGNLHQPEEQQHQNERVIKLEEDHFWTLTETLLINKQMIMNMMKYVLLMNMFMNIIMQ